MTVRDIDDNGFADGVLDHAGTVIVDFWAAWCGPCRQISPVLDEISENYPHLRVVKVNTDDNPKTTTAYGVSSVPTVMVFVDGQAVRAISGARSKSALVRELSEWLS